LNYKTSQTGYDEEEREVYNINDEDDSPIFDSEPLGSKDLLASRLEVH